jgi:arylsulfatase A-like enzyme
MYAAEAARLIQAHDTSLPFFLYLAFTNVHDPKQAPSEFTSRYDGVVTDTKRKIFGGMVSALDDATHHVVQTLKQQGMWVSGFSVIYAQEMG